jgi:hypothetical protein
VKPNPAFATVRDHRIPHLDTGGDTPQSDPYTAAGKEVGERNDEILKGAETPAAWDASLSWGRNGGVESNHERQATAIPAAAEASSGFQGAPFAAAVDPTPAPLGTPLQPASGNGAAGNFNMSDIANFKIG